MIAPARPVSIVGISFIILLSFISLGVAFSWGATPEPAIREGASSPKEQNGSFERYVWEDRELLTVSREVVRSYFAFNARR